LIITMTTLPHLIARSDWDNVNQRLTSSPEQASIEIPTASKYTVYPIHQAICSKKSCITCETLILMIRSFPEALDLNVFRGACENPSFSREAMEILLSSTNTTVSRLVEENASSYASIALKRKNVGIVDLFINRYPEVLDGNILIDACKNCTAIMVEKILMAGVRKSIERNGGLYRKNKSDEDALSIAIRYYDENDEERQNILSICLRYANIDENDKKVMPEPGYSLILAAIGRVPQDILESILKRNAHELKNTDYVGKIAVVKAINMAKGAEQNESLPDIFTSSDLIDACTNGTPSMVQLLLENGSQHVGCESKSESQENNQNALDIAVSLYNGDDDDRCEILKSCVQYANAVKMNLKFPSPEYPTLLAAVGFVPLDLLYSIGKKYQCEMKNTDLIGKAALKTVVRLAGKKVTVPDHIFQHIQIPDQIKFDSRWSYRRMSRLSISE